MSHKKELVTKIINILSESYPPEMYTYITEEGLKISKQRIYPDVQIFKNDKLVCVVEIGYTRPEKIEHYRKLKIPDIRWYSKSGNLISEPKEKEIRNFKWVPSKEEVWRNVSLTEQGGLTCWQCHDQDVENFILSSLDLDDEKIDLLTKEEKENLIKNVSDEVKDEAYTEADEEQCIEGELWSNGSRVFSIGICDNCGETVFTTGPDLSEVNDDDLVINHDIFLERHYKEMEQKVFSFDQLKQFIMEEFNYELKYPLIQDKKEIY